MLTLKEYEISRIVKMIFQRQSAVQAPVLLCVHFKITQRREQIFRCEKNIIDEGN